MLSGVPPRILNSLSNPSLPKRIAVTLMQVCLLVLDLLSNITKPFCLLFLLARKFHELNQAYELLLDPLRRMAVDAKLRLKEARKARFSSYDAKRKGLVEELEARERAFKKAKVEKEEEEKARWRENERIMEEGKKLREEREKELRRKEMEREEAAKATVRDNEPPTLGMTFMSLPSPIFTDSADVYRSFRHDRPTEIPAFHASLTDYAVQS